MIDSWRSLKKGEEDSMVCNVGGIDRIVRVLVGALLTVGAFMVFPGVMYKTIALVTAASLFATAWFGFCFINKMLGVNTARPRVPIKE
jgi:hypothetical protein